MIKQTATYGVWKVDRHDDNKVEVYKNGELCEKSTPALREIAAEIGLELNPEWRTSQLGANVLKAMLNAGEEKPQVSETKEAVVASKPKEKTLEEMSIKELSELYKAKKLPIDAKDGDINKALYEVFQNLIPGFIIPQTETKPVEEVTPETDKPKYDVNSVENSEDFYKNDPDLKAFYKEWKSYTKEQFDALLNAANNGDAIAQYKCGYVYWYAADAKDKVENWFLSESGLKMWQEWLDKVPKYIDLSQAENNAGKWLKAAAEQGLGVAMSVLGDYYLCTGYILGAVRWKDRCAEVSPWHESLYVNFPDAGRHLREYQHQLKEIHEKGKELSELLENRAKEGVLKDKYLEGYNKYYKLCEEKDKRIKELEEKYAKLQDKEEALHQKYDELMSSESSRSSSRSSSDDEVTVKVTYTTKNLLLSGIKNSWKGTMTKAEYKSLLNGSMKARIAWVKANCEVGTFSDVLDATISLA